MGFSARFRKAFLISIMRPMELRLVHNIHLQIQICHQETKVGVAQEDVVETQLTSISSYMHTMNLSNPNFTFFRQLLYFIKHLHMCSHNYSTNESCYTSKTIRLESV